jgi:hypothetical protein
MFMRNNIIINVRLKPAKNAKETLEERLAKFIAGQSCGSKLLFFMVCEFGNDFSAPNGCRITSRTNAHLSHLRPAIARLDSRLLPEALDQCRECGQVLRDTEMAYYGGPGGANLGVCSKCSRKGR